MNPIVRPFPCRVILSAGLVTCLVASASAQGYARGIVKDMNGHGIPGATVTAESLVSTLSKSDTTDNSGRFSFIGLAAGEWLFVIRADGFEPVQGFGTVRRTGLATAIEFTMKTDRFNPPAPTAGILAGLKASELVERLEQADALFDRTEYDAAIEAYRSILERAPALTSVSLQIGHAFREKQEPDEALAAYQMVLAADPSNVEARAAIAAINQTAR